MLYTMIFDYHHYLAMAWDREQITSQVGEMGSAMDKRIDMWNAPRSYEGVFSETLRVSFPKTLKEDKNCEIPDIGIIQGRIFLNKKSYDVLKPLIEQDGEFISVKYEYGDAFIFTPLRVAEHADALDKKLSRKNEWGDVEHIAFHEEKVKDWAVFRCEFNAYMSVYCQEQVKDAIQKAGLKGLYFTADLANIFPEERREVGNLDS